MDEIQAKAVAGLADPANGIGSCESCGAFRRRFACCPRHRVGLIQDVKALVHPRQSQLSRAA